MLKTTNFKSIFSVGVFLVLLFCQNQMQASDCEDDLSSRCFFVKVVKQIGDRVMPGDYVVCHLKGLDVSDSGFNVTLRKAVSAISKHALSNGYSLEKDCCFYNSALEGRCPSVYMPVKDDGRSMSDRCSCSGLPRGRGCMGCMDAHGC